MKKYILWNVTEESSLKDGVDFLKKQYGITATSIEMNGKDVKIWGDDNNIVVENENVLEDHAWIGGNE